MYSTNEIDDLLSLSPVAQYSSPNYPTNTEADSNPALLKKLPSRWQRNAAAFACVGFLGTVTLTSCDPFLHGGGSGGAPIYVVYLTEQEALAMIRSRLEAAGLDFSATPPAYSIALSGLGNYRLLFDGVNKVAVSMVLENYGGSFEGSYMKDRVEEVLSNELTDYTVGVFFSPGVSYDNKPSASQENTSKKKLEAHFINQINKFIELLITKGILNPES
jgi:hypothetical protein